VSDKHPDGRLTLDLQKLVWVFFVRQMIRNRGTWIEFGFEKKLFYVTKRKHAQGSKKERGKRMKKKKTDGWKHFRAS
jgi:hypothetical protein